MSEPTLKEAAAWFLEVWLTDEWLKDGYHLGISIECEMEAADEIRDQLVFAENELEKALA